MDTSLDLRGWHWRPTDWTAAAVAGLAAGAVLMVLDLLWSSLYSPEGPWRTAHMIAPIFVGTEALRTTGYAFDPLVVSVALAVHYLLGMLWGLVAATLMVQFQLDARPARAALAGATMGIALYLFNFEGLAAFFPWLAELRGRDTIAAHVVFGLVAALLYWRLKRTGPET